MSAPSSHLDEPAAIRMVFQRLCRLAANVHLKAAAFEDDFPVLAEDEDRLILGISDVVRGQWSLKPGGHVLMTLEDRGRRYEAVLEVESHGRCEGVECCFFEMPRMLKALDEHRLADYVPDRPMPCTFTSPSMDILEGRMKALGNQGIELVPGETKPGRAVSLKLGAMTTLEMNLDKETRVVLSGVVAYFGDNYAGVRFKDDADLETLRAYQAWLFEAIRNQQRQDREGFDPKGSRSPRTEGVEEVRASQGGAKLLVDRDPLILLIAEADGLSQRMAAALGRKFGFAFLDYIKGEVRPQLESLGVNEESWSRVKLLLVTQRQRLTSGLELTKQLSQEESCPLPILVVGTEEDVGLKRNRAISCGAVDFIAVEPFNVLRVMKAIDETLKLFQ